MMAVITALATRRADALGVARTRLVTPLAEQAPVTADPAAGTSPQVEVAGRTS